ncbi:MAG: MBL fold metallo-hydrolase [Deltaproteobacteria bacterium]|jgi:ribonuclease BN (tRNA processing enzyme)
MTSPTLEFLGTGSAFTTDPDNYQSNLLLTGASGRRLLVDCGGDVRRALFVRGVHARDLEAVYISHLHADHAGGLEWLGFTTHFDPSAPRLTLFAAEPLIEPMWNNVLSGGMRHTVGAEGTLSTYFELAPLAERGSFTWDGVELSLVPTPHIIGSAGTITSYGLFITGAERSVFLTTDTVYAWHDAFDTADVVLHDCETSGPPTGAHPTYATLVEELPKNVRAKTWLYGYPPGALPDAAADGFLGFARPGQRFAL